MATQENKVGTTISMDSVIKAVSEKSKDTETSLTIKEVTHCMNLFKETIIEALNAGAKVQLTGFFSVEPSYRKEKQGNNVITQEKITIPESAVISMKAGKLLKDVAKSYDKGMINNLKNYKKPTNTAAATEPAKAAAKKSKAKAK